MVEAPIAKPHADIETALWHLWFNVCTCTVNIK